MSDVKVLDIKHENSKTSLVQHTILITIHLKILILASEIHVFQLQCKIVVIYTGSS